MDGELLTRTAGSAWMMGKRGVDAEERREEEEEDEEEDDDEAALPLSSELER
jgi:hypothetical protein